MTNELYKKLMAHINISFNSIKNKLFLGRPKKRTLVIYLLERP